jgi:DNA-directed RNA polymerase specialized sigma24 family protein
MEIAVEGNSAEGDKTAQALFMKANNLRFDSLVARYYPAVYSLAAKLTDDPRHAAMLTQAAFSSTQKRLAHLRSKEAIATTLVSAVVRAGLQIA